MYITNQQEDNKMTIEEIIEQEEGEFDKIIYEEGIRFEDSTEITESDVCGSDEARDYSTVNDEDGRTLYILVQPEKAIRYIHVGAPAPQYAINSIHSIEGAIVQAAMAVGVYARTTLDAPTPKLQNRPVTGNRHQVRSKALAGSRNPADH